MIAMRSIADIFTLEHERQLNRAVNKIDVELYRHVAVRIIAPRTGVTRL